MKLKIEVFSQFLFDEDCKFNGFNDANVDEKNIGFISIIGTKECLEYYLDEADTKHFFSDGHKNVLNLEFDDTPTDILYHGHLLRTISMEQAEKTVDFIEDCIERGISCLKIHCRAGYSRSRAMAEFIYRMCIENGIEVDYDERNEYSSMLNHTVLRKLNNAYWKKHKMKGYENGEDYPEELTNQKAEEINE